MISLLAGVSEFSPAARLLVARVRARIAERHGLTPEAAQVVLS